jgi:uncharacterized protein YdaU (DUF1376 family)
VKIRRIDFSPDEWLAGTVGLDNGTRGLYITACALIYSHGGPIPAVELRRACHDHGHAFKRQLSCLISTGKLTVNDGQIDNKRCANELKNACKRSLNARQNVAERWKNKQVGTEPVLQGGNANHQPSTISKEADASLPTPPGSKDPSGVVVRSPPRGSRLSPDLVELSPDWALAAVEARQRAGLRELDLALEWEKFRNYWLAKAGRDARKTDWKKTWANWALSATPPWTRPLPSIGAGKYDPGYVPPANGQGPTGPPPKPREWREDRH